MLQSCCARLPQWLKFFSCVLLGAALTTGLAWSYPPGFAPFLGQYSLSPPPAIASSADSLLEQGRQDYNAERFTDAIAAWSQAEDLLRSHNNSLQQALALSYLTAAHQQLGQWDVAHDNIHESLDLLPPAATSSLEQQVTAQVHNTLGSLQFAQGHTQDALVTWQYAANLYDQIGDESRYLNNLINQVRAQQTLGYYQRARDTLATLEQRLPEQDLSLQIRGYQRLGQTYRLIGDFKSSKERLETARELMQHQATDAGPVLLELGNTEQAEGKLGDALESYQAAAEQSSSDDIRLKARLNALRVLVQIDPAAARREIATLADDITAMEPGRSQIYAYINASQSLLQLGSAAEIETAARLLAQAIQQSMALPDSRAEAYARGYLGQLYETTQQWSEAQALTEEALTIAQAINAADITYQWQWQRGRLLKQQGEREAALQAYRQAYSTLQTLRQDLVATNQDLQFSFRDSVEPVYRELVDLLLQPDETSRDDTSQMSQGLKDNASSTLMAQDQRRQSQLQEAREIIESLQVAELDNFFRTACLEAQQVALEEVEQTTAAIIYPIILPDRLEMIVSLPGQPLQQYTSMVSQADLEDTLVEWRLNLEKPFTTPEGEQDGEKLYNWLIQPMQAVLTDADIQTLTFVLDGALRNAPMAALYDGEQYLIQQYAVALSPGLQLLGPRSLQETNLTALLGGLTQAREEFSALINVEDELQNAYDLLSGRLLLDQEFTTQNLTQQVTESDRPIVHLATHGQFSSDAESTFILAWDRRIPVKELGALLRAGDLNRLNPIELLVLSACETAEGDKRAALGLAGVALESGTRSTLASLWNLGDESGSVFIEHFYKALTDPQTTKAEALRQAQLEFLEGGGNYRHPTYWSAYVLVGNWL
ncbi:MAG: CHAT domain-containing protein [Leptolyngbya sp. SIO1E4]|nr:CHAT domain-containing protein [Leptolyngbya sp. SIO1E4]